VAEFKNIAKGSISLTKAAQRGELARKTITVVAPVYNEAAVVEDFVEEILNTFEEVNFPGTFSLLLVNDGSSDESPQLLDSLARKHGEKVTVLHLSRNYGHESAVTAGLESADADAIILMDSDLQDDPQAFHAFVEKWVEGYDVVYAVRSSRRENAFMRFMFWSFYKILSKLSNFPLPMNAGNFSLMDRKVVKHVIAMDERNRYLPGIRAWVGFRQTGVDVSRRNRHDQKPRVGFRAKWTLAMNAIFSFSYVPIFFFRAFGVISLLISLLLFILALITGVVQGSGFSGLLSPLIWVSFFAGINLFGISVVGEYVARIYDEVKRRPKYIVERTVKSNQKELSNDDQSHR
jgi:glycosyltransferase involved in cell wall biosynthesis